MDSKRKANGVGSREGDSRSAKRRKTEVSQRHVCLPLAERQSLHATEHTRRYTIMLTRS